VEVVEGMVEVSVVEEEEEEGEEEEEEEEGEEGKEPTPWLLCKNVPTDISWGLYV
jgi:hypothetical protein